MRRLAGQGDESQLDTCVSLLNIVSLDTQGLFRFIDAAIHEVSVSSINSILLQERLLHWQTLTNKILIELSLILCSIEGLTHCYFRGTPDLAVVFVPIPYGIRLLIRYPFLKSIRRTCSSKTRAYGNISPESGIAHMSSCHGSFCAFGTVQRYRSWSVPSRCRSASCGWWCSGSRGSSMSVSRSCALCSSGHPALLSPGYLRLLPSSCQTIDRPGWPVFGKVTMSEGGLGHGVKGPVTEMHRSLNERGSGSTKAATLDTFSKEPV